MDIENGTTTTIPLSGVVGVGGPVSWSPDGTTVLFNTFDGQQEHLVTAKSNGTDVREIDTSSLSAGSHVELWPAGWSPTGDRVAFVAATEPDGGEGTVYVVRPDGADLQAVGPERVETYSVSWSPDPAVERLVLATNDSAGSSVQILDLPSGNLTPVDRGFWPTWSPDGSRIAYWNDGTVVAETAGALAGAPVKVRPYPQFTGNCQDHPDLAGAAYCGPAAWSPDGQRLLAPDIVGGSILSVMADGTGEPIVIPVDSASPDEEASGLAADPALTTRTVRPARPDGDAGRLDVPRVGCMAAWSIESPVIPGDGIGPELAEATRRVLDATGIEFEWEVARRRRRPRSPRTARPHSGRCPRVDPAQ